MGGGLGGTNRDGTRWRPAVAVTPRQLSLAALANAFKAALTGRRVSEAERDRRGQACSSCEYLRHDKLGPFCGLCGCTVVGEENRIFNMAAVAESLPDWGCKHPARAAGKGWGMVE